MKVTICRDADDGVIKRIEFRLNNCRAKFQVAYTVQKVLGEGVVDLPPLFQVARCQKSIGIGRVNFSRKIKKWKILKI